MLRISYLERPKGAIVGQKVNPISFRLGRLSDWRSKWFAKRNYSKLLLEDLRIRQYIMKKLATNFISKVNLDRDKNNVTVTIYTARPGMIIGLTF